MHALPAAADLAADGASSRVRRVPILLMFDREDCPYCEIALRQHLVPMSGEAPWRDDALFRQVEVARSTPVVDFEGRATTHRALAARYGVSLTPTIVVVDATGAPLADPVVGLLTADFYGAYLDAALRAGLAKLRPRDAGSSR
ncbi:MAG: thioredoxin fold domain-containing protein [Betaproteobacteria bacterium]